jgi:hypothetical protein
MAPRSLHRGLGDFKGEPAGITGKHTVDLGLIDDRPQAAMLSLRYPAGGEDEWLGILDVNAI